MTEPPDTQTAAGIANARPIYSMTGYSTAQGTTEDGAAFTLTLKSVNHRFLDLNLRMPSDCDGLEVALRRLIKESVHRGHVDVTLHVDRRAREAGQAIHLNRELLAAHIRIFHEAAKLHHFNVEPDLNELLRMPGVLLADSAAPDASTGIFESGDLNRENKVPAIRLECHSKVNDIRGSIYVRHSKQPELDPTNWEAPLIRRAWVFQESILSPRVLSYDENHLR